MEGQKVLWVGLDVGKQSISAALDPSAFKAKALTLAELPVKDFPRKEKNMDTLIQWIEDCRCELEQHHGFKPEVRVVMEITGCYSKELTQWLKTKYPECAPISEPGSVINAFKKSLKISHETDRLDAKAIARYGYERSPVSEMAELPAPYQTLQELVRERDALIKARVELENRRDSLFNVVVKRINQHAINDLNRQILLLDKEIKGLVSSHEEMLSQIHIMTTSPGVSFLSAVVIIAELGPLTRFRNSRQLSAYSGLAPRIKESGTSIKKSVLSRRGSAKLRQILYLDSMNAVAKITCLQNHYKNLLAKGKSKMTARCACMRKHLIMLHAMVVTKTPFDPNFQQHTMKNT